MRTLTVVNCCTAREFDSFPTDNFLANKGVSDILKKQIADAMTRLEKANVKIIHAYLTDKQTIAMKILRSFKFKRAGRIDSRVDTHGTKLYLYYYVFTGK